MLSNIVMQAKEFLSLATDKEQEGQGLIEYALIVLLIAIGVLVILGLVGGQVQDIFNQIYQGLGGTATP